MNGYLLERQVAAMILLLVCMLSTTACNEICDRQVEATLPIVACGKIERFEKFSSKFVSARNVDIWLPDGYSKQERYAVLYMQDGQMLFDSTTTWNHQEWGVDEVAGRLIDEEVIDKCIIVGIWNSGNGRHSDYFPQKPFESLPRALQDSLLYEVKRDGEALLFASPVHSDNYLRFLVEELKPYVDATYSTKPEKENTFVVGSSMGGLISLYAICEYPEIFGGAACLSTHWTGTFSKENNPIPEVFAQYLKNHLPSAANHKIYFDYGTETLDAIYARPQKEVDEIMQANGFSDPNWMTRMFPGESHNENAWRKRLYVPLTFLLAQSNTGNEQVKTRL